jgi:starch-binding outer membrane protein, SusD/RagB family
MKKILKYIPIITLVTGLSACHDLEIPVTTEMTPDIFPTDSVQYIQASGPVYAAFRGNFALDYWFIQTLSTDEAILPAHGGGWLDGGKHKDLHYHTWTQDNAFVNSTWVWLSQVISYANQTLSILEANEPDSYTLKKTNLAEVRMMRAIAYFMMMDLYGNVPIVTEYGDFSMRANSTRKEVFDFIVNEVNQVLPDLSDQIGATTYGRPTKYAAHALLAKMYLNAEVYTGEPRNNECIAACDAIISSGKFSLEGIGTYLQMFYPNNGPSTKEFIFAIPYDPAAGVLPGTNGYMYRARYDMPNFTSIQSKFGIPFKPSGPESTIPEFYAFFEEDENDVRNGQWLAGTVYAQDGVTPILTLTKEIELRVSVEGFDVGSDNIGWSMGYRNMKFYPDATSLNRNQNNDVPFLRYSDIILMKAEAILRGGNTTLGATALSLVNDLRSNRTTSDPWATVTLEDLYAERSREFAMETWRRNDMIRFGKYEDSWGFKTDDDVNKRLFPIPTIAFTYNTKLKQNFGY